MLAVDLSDLSSGSVSVTSVTSIPPRDPLSSEGISLVALPTEPAGVPGGTGNSPSKGHTLLAFGGYNGKYQVG